MAQASQGPRTYRFSAQRVRVTRRRKPGEEGWAVYRRNLDGSEPRYYLSNAPEDTTLETLAYVGGSRWRIETEFETEKGEVGLDEYETRSWPGWHHHIAMCLLGGAFLLGLQQDWGGKMPRITRPQLYRVVREMLPRERFGPEELLLWLKETQLLNERARRSHERRRSARLDGHGVGVGDLIQLRLQEGRDAGRRIPVAGLQQRNGHLVTISKWYWSEKENPKAVGVR